MAEATAVSSPLAQDPEQAADAAQDALTALAHQPDQRAPAGDTHWRCQVRARPAPADVIQVVQDAAMGLSPGWCQTPVAARQLWQALITQAWQLLPSQDADAGRGPTRDLHVRLRVGQRVHALRVRRHPEWVLVSVGRPRVALRCPARGSVDAAQSDRMSKASSRQ